MNTAAPDSVASRSAAGREVNGGQASGSTPRVKVTTRPLPRGRLGSTEIGSTATRLFRDPWQPTHWIRSQLLELNSLELWRQAVLEAIFTGLWVLGSILIISESVLWDPRGNLPGRTILVGSFLHTLMFTIYIQVAVTTAGKDGGQPTFPSLNPAITFLQVLKGVQGPIPGLLVMVAQCAGAILAALCAKDLLPQDRIDLYMLGGCFGRRTVPLPDGTSTTMGFSDHKYFLVEFVFAFTFLYVVSLVTHPTQLRILGLKWAVIFISANIGFNTYLSTAIRPGYSGSMFNPARCLGPAVAYGKPLWDRLWQPFFVPFVAAVAVAFIFVTVPPDHVEVYAKKKDVISKIKRWSGKNLTRRGDNSNSSRLDDDIEPENHTVYEVPSASRLFSATPETPDVRRPPETHWREAAIEAIFTWMWVFAALLIGSAKELWGPANPVKGRAILVVAFLNMVMFLLYIQLATTFATRNGSEGGKTLLPHLNPAVTFLQVLNGVQGLRAGLLFVIAQFGGAILASVCAKELLPQDRIDNFLLGGCFGRRTFPLANGTESISTGLSDHRYFLVEFAFSFTFLYVSSLLTTPSQLRALRLKWVVVYISIDIGFLVYLSSVIGPGYSGSMFNPARCLGPAVAYGPPLWERLWPAFTAPFVAALPVAFIFRATGNRLDESVVGVAKRPEVATTVWELFRGPEVVSTVRGWFRGGGGGEFRSASPRVIDDGEVEIHVVSGV